MKVIARNVLFARSDTFEMSEIALKLREHSRAMSTIHPRVKKGHCHRPELLKKTMKLEVVQMLATQGPDRSKITPYPHAFKASQHLPLPFPAPNSAHPAGSR